MNVARIRVRMRLLAVASFVVVIGCGQPIPQASLAPFALRNVHVPLVFSFWFTVAAYVVHCIDESLLGGGFVEKVRQRWWPKYSWTKFFWSHSAYFLVMITSVVLYDFRGGAWMFLPLAWVIERACNGVWHVAWSVRFHEYSPGLVSSILMWMNLYFVVRYHPADEAITPKIWIPALMIVGFFMAFLVMYFPFVKERQMRGP